MTQTLLLQRNIVEEAVQLSTRAKVLIAALLLFGGSVFALQIWLSGEIATAGEQINLLEEKKEALELEHARLVEERNKQISLASIEEKAKEMGFVKVHPEQVEFIDPLESFASLTSQ